MIVRFLQQMKDPMILILLAAALVSGVTAAIENELCGCHHHPRRGHHQRGARRCSGEQGRRLRRSRRCPPLPAARCATVRYARKNGRALWLATHVVLLEAGDAIHTRTGRILRREPSNRRSGAHRQSVPLNRQSTRCALARQRTSRWAIVKNMVYMGSTVVYGRGKAVIVATGITVRNGQNGERSRRPKTGKPAAGIKLSQLSKVLTWLVLGICVAKYSA